MNLDDILACPACRSAGLDRLETTYRCRSCGAAYQLRDGIPDFIIAGADILSRDAARQEFWDEGWTKRFGQAAALSRDETLRFRAEFRDELVRQRYPSVTEIGPDLVRGKVFVNVGCGGGQEGLLFAGYGSRYIGIDFSHNAARLTTVLLRAAGYDGVAYQAEAERLPLRDDCVDFVYSNGVLHHTPDTAATLREIYRVLKPDGIAFIGLYASRSVNFFWYRLHALLRGNLTPRARQRWLDANTEGEWQTEGRVNQLTKTYTKREYTELLHSVGFRDFRIEQTVLPLVHAPVLSRIASLGLPKSMMDLSLGRFGMILMARCRKF